MFCTLCEKCSPTHFIVARYRMPSHPSPHPGGRHRRRVPRGGPAWGARRPPATSRRRHAGAVRREAVTRAPAPDTDRPRAAASCHARGTPVHVTCAPAPPWSPRPAAILGSGPKSAPLTGCPRGFSQVAGNDHPSGAHFSGCQGVPALSRGDPGPWPRRARGGSGAGAGSAACDYEAYWGAY